MRTVLFLASALAVCTKVYAAGAPITDFGAKPDGSKCTAAFARAIGACADAGGGRVVVPPGRWMTGAIHLKSNVELHLENGAEVVFSQDIEDYLPAVQTSYEGTECWNYSPLIYAFGCTNVAITGSGTASLRAFEGGHADSIWGRWTRERAFRRESARKLEEWSAKDVPVDRRRISDEKDSCTRPHFIQFNRCRNVRLENVRIRNSPFWAIHLFLCDGAVVRDVDVVARHSNNDGIDIEMSRNVLVERCSFDQGDDTFVIKSGRNRDGWRLATPTENVEIRDCRMKRAKSFFTVGSEISGGVRNVWMHDCSVDEAVLLAYIKTNRRRGGFVENVRMENVRGGKVDTLFGVETEVFYGTADFPEHEVRRTRIADISLQNVFCDEARTRVDIQGDALLPVSGVAIRNVHAGSVRIPDRLVNVTDVVEDGRRVSALRDFPISGFGAKADGSDSSAAIARAVDAAATAGGGRVVVPPGTWKTGPIELKKGVELHLAASSRLLFSDDPADYALPDGGFRPLLSAEDIEHVRVSGGFGILEALVDGWRTVPVEKRPPLVRLSRCAGLCVESAALHNAPGKVVELADCENAIFTSVEFTANVSERDFISTVSGSCPTVQSCSFRIGDGTWDVLDPRHRIVHPPVNLFAETPEETAARIRWFTDARFGMFIHFGAYSLAARHEWVKNYENLSDAEYERYVENFDPDLFDAREWVRAAKDAGMKYIVLTTKHHDGFCLFDSKLTDYKATNAPFGRDVVKEFADACHEAGIRCGFYYSLLDWHHPDYTKDYWYPGCRGKTKDELDELNKGRDFAKYLDYMHGQVRELLTGYGRVDILWYDFSTKDRRVPWRDTFKYTEDWRGAELLAMTRELQPGIVVNDRLGSGVPADVVTPEQEKTWKWPTHGGRPAPAWESCQTFSGSWGYNRDEMTWKDVRQLLTMIIDNVSKGGNTILNVGPTGRGAFDERAKDRLAGIGKWMKLNGRSIYGCGPAPEGIAAPEGTILTYNRGKNRLYVHLIDYPIESLPISFSENVKYAQFLHDASEIKVKIPLSVDGTPRTDVDPSFILPVVKPDVEIPVIEVFLK